MTKERAIEVIQSMNDKLRYDGYIKDANNMAIEALKKQIQGENK